MSSSSEATRDKRRSATLATKRSRYSSVSKLRGNDQAIQISGAVTSAVLCGSCAGAAGIDGTDGAARGIRSGMCTRNGACKSRGDRLSATSRSAVSRSTSPRMSSVMFSGR